VIKLQVSAEVHTRSLEAVAAADSNSFPKQTVNVWHCLFELTVGADVWNSSVAQLWTSEQPRSDVVVEGVAVYSKAEQVDRPTQTRSEEVDKGRASN
jgi:hypothetical protein